MMFRIIFSFRPVEKIFFRNWNCHEYPNAYWQETAEFARKKWQ